MTRLARARVPIAVSTTISATFLAWSTRCPLSTLTPRDLSNASVLQNQRINSITSGNQGSNPTSYHNQQPRTGQTFSVPSSRQAPDNLQHRTELYNKRSMEHSRDMVNKEAVDKILLFAEQSDPEQALQELQAALTIQDIPMKQLMACYSSIISSFCR